VPFWAAAVLVWCVLIWAYLIRRRKRQRKPPD
jgi:hypothetical protein